MAKYHVSIVKSFTESYYSKYYYCGASFVPTHQEPGDEATIYGACIAKPLMQEISPKLLATKLGGGD